MPFAHIVVATDFTEKGERAVGRAIALARESKAMLSLLHVLEKAPAPNPLYAHYEVNSTLEQLERARAATQQALEAVMPEDMNSQTGVISVREGDPAEEIDAFATEVGADLIVCATHGRHGVTRMLLGSVSEALVRTAHVSVLVVR